MPPRQVPRGAMSQEAVFFTREWTRQVDELFIRGLCEQTVVGNFIARGNTNRRAISYSRDRVNGDLGTHFDYETCVERFRKLYKRYQVFKYIIEFPGVQHNDLTHNVRADEMVWNAICRDHALAYAYMREGERSYDPLSFIFTAIPEVPVNGGEMVEVVQISSDNDSIEVNGNESGVFDGELAWYNSDGDEVSNTSTNVRSRGRFGGLFRPRNEARGRPSIPRTPGSGPSSQASSSPYKPE